MTFNPLPGAKISIWSKLKAFADNKLTKAQNILSSTYHIATSSCKRNIEKQDVLVKHHAPAKGLFLDSFGVTGKC